MSRKLTTDVLIIGAGPAGIAAAIEARQAGAKTIVVDSFDKAGGQYWMQSEVGKFQATKQIREGASLISKCEELGATILSNAEVWAILPKYRVFVQQGIDGTVEIVADSLIVCTGAHDMVFPFSGWTLPGVMTAGAGQRYVKQSGTSPGKKIVLAGTGIFLWAVAATIVKAGGNLVAMVESNMNRFKTFRLVSRYPDRWPEVWRLMAPVISAGVRRHYGYRIESATGSNRVESVTVQPVLSNGISRHKELTFETDCLLVSHGFRPMTEITAFLRCNHQFDSKKGGWYCVTDPESGATSVDNVHAAGEITGIAGAQSAFIQGALAGIAASKQLGFSRNGLESRLADLKNRRLKVQKFADELADLFEVCPEAIPTVDQDTLVCRCEEVSWGEVLNAWDDGATDLQAVKFWTRLGMGRCQGRICGTAVSNLLMNEFQLNPGSLGFNQPRLPLRPIPVESVRGAFAGQSFQDS